MTSHVNRFILLSLLDTSAVSSKVPSSPNQTYTRLSSSDTSLKKSTEMNQLAVTAKIQSCIQKSQDNAHNTQVACSSPLGCVAVVSCEWVSVPCGVVGCGSVWLLHVSLCVYWKAICDFLISAVWRKLTNKSRA